MKRAALCALQQIGVVRVLPKRICAPNSKEDPCCTESGYCSRSTRSRRSAEHTSELQSLICRPYAVLCLNKRSQLSHKVISHSLIVIPLLHSHTNYSHYSTTQLYTMPNSLHH